MKSYFSFRLIVLCAVFFISGIAHAETLTPLWALDGFRNPESVVYDAKRKVLSLSGNYRPSRPLTGLKAPGRSVGATLKSQLWNMKMGGFITEYEEYLGGVIAGVITGGDVPGGTLVTEEYLLDLEREAFVVLCGQKKTRERIEHMLKKGKALRN